MPRTSVPKTAVAVTCATVLPPEIRLKHDILCDIAAPLQMFATWLDHFMATYRSDETLNEETVLCLQGGQRTMARLIADMREVHNQFADDIFRLDREHVAIREDHSQVLIGPTRRLGEDGAL